MNYEKKYKEALERARELLSRCIKDSDRRTKIYRVEDIESIFPELKENEDERIRKEIISFIADRKNWFPKEETKASWISWLEKQGEQKSDDKVEPKFKVGDWISGYYTNYKVLSINNEGYVVEDVDGNKINILFENEKFHHLFTIADAKDGDVLVTTKIRTCLFIYRKTDRKNNLTYYYAGIDGNGNFVEGCLKRTSYHFGLVSDVIPATKGQRDLLFQKMKEAGYEFDFEKKELKKIEQKPAWSKEDEQMILGIEQVMNCASLLNIVPEKIGKVKSWLKSLKERICNVK